MAAGGSDRAGEAKGGQMAADERRARLAAELRQNLQRRKDQARARRAGEADSRGEGLPAAGPSSRHEGREDGNA
ncbi:MAG TPA: hypothetical protein VGN97_06930 [Mesorhizobium sp.]|nr:hypothetical protein [Mesorhizobium sp.]